MQDFVKKDNLEHVEYGSTTTGRWMRVEIWDLEKFTAFDAYGDGPDKRHYGTVWTNPNGNAVGVVGPAVLHWKQKWKTDTAPEKTTVQCLVNSMRWNGATIALAAFKGTVDKTSKMKSLTQRHILRTKEEGVTAAIAALRERVWKLTSRLEMMASLGAINAYYTPTVTAVATTTLYHCHCYYHCTERASETHCRQCSSAGVPAEASHAAGNRAKESGV